MLLVGLIFLRLKKYSNITNVFFQQIKKYLGLTRYDLIDLESSKTTRITGTKYSLTKKNSDNFFKISR